MRHRKSIPRIALALIIFVGTVSTFANHQPQSLLSKSSSVQYEDPDAYLIYALLLQSEKHADPVIRAETESWADAVPDKMGIKGDRGFKKVWGSSLKNYAERYRVPMLLTRQIPLDSPYHLVAQTEIEAIFQSGGNWGEFYQLYPGSGGFVSFSPVGFDPERVHAIVWMYLHCGGLCGHGRPHFFQKTSGRWTEVSVRAEVQVLFS